jgi:hypothetical protein
MMITCEHCDSEIDVAQDPRCVVYDPSGATDVMCKKCKELMWEQMCEAYRIKRGWRA